jgi:hypothetical protein
MRDTKIYGKILFSLILAEVFSSDVDEKYSYYRKSFGKLRM